MSNDPERLKTLKHHLLFLTYTFSFDVLENMIMWEFFYYLCALVKGRIADIES